MKLTYQIEGIKHNIFIKKKIDLTLTNQINYLKSDKKVLLIYDNNIEKNLVDKIIASLKETGCKVITLEFRSSKKNKNEQSLFTLIDVMLNNKFTKKSLVISFGGGVLGDVCALASSLYLRGLIYFHVPSMTAIIDSCIGGKTAINYKNVINSLGNYYHAQSVFIFNEVINLLPEREFLSGIPEIIKCGLIKKNNILNILETKKTKVLKRDESVIAELCKETLLTKIFFFESDVYEKKNRLFLNFGHTFAHAIEMSTQSILNKEILRHGEAVGIGILCEIYFSSSKEKKLLIYVKSLLSNYSLPTEIDQNLFKNKKTILLDSIYKNIFLDKKKINKNPRYISLKKLYKPQIKEIQDTSLLAETINKFI